MPATLFLPYNGAHQRLCSCAGLIVIKTPQRATYASPFGIFAYTEFIVMLCAQLPTNV